ncbi:MAG: TatD family hydrolase [Chthonomonadales bacterium]
MIVDTHCHLNHEKFQGDVEGAVRRAEARGVERIIVVGYDVPSSEAAVRLAEEFSQVFAAVGVHPHDARTYSGQAHQHIRKLAGHSRVVAVGEIGLDYHYHFSPAGAQLAAFEAQLQIALDTGLPVIIHCREAYGPTLDVLERLLDRCHTGVMHCWAGTQEEAHRALDLGLYLGFGGVITFKNAEALRRVAAAVPADRILLETDAPYLAPEPYRGKRNEPAYISFVLDRLASIRAMPPAELAAVTTINARRVFSRLGSKLGSLG